MPIPDPPLIAMIVEAVSSEASRSAADQLFVHWTGVDPARFRHSLTLSSCRKKIEQSAQWPPAQAPRTPVICSLIDLSSTPGQQGQGVTIRYGRYGSPFGDCLLAMTGDAVCHLCFVDRDQWQPSVAALARLWPRALLMADHERRDQETIERIFAPAAAEGHGPLRIVLRGTSFQLRVWQSLLTLPWGSLISYQGLAGRLGNPSACRAVARAVAANPVAYLIPCHRVIRKSGAIHNYRWGSVRKQAMLGWEACRE